MSDEGKRLPDVETVPWRREPIEEWGTGSRFGQYLLLHTRPERTSTRALERAGTGA